MAFRDVVRQRFGQAAAGVLALLLTACSSGGYYTGDYRNIPPVWVVRNAPVPVPHPVMRPRPPERAVARSTARTAAARPAPSRTVQVRKGDTVYAISRRTGVHVRAIIAANDLRPPYLLKPGDRLRLPAANVHVVRKGETSYSISRAYGVDLSELVRMNGMRRPYTLYPGQKLKLPPSARPSSTQVSTGTSTPASIPAPPPRTGTGFDWPVRGQILSGFGPKNGGLHNDGINIRAARGASVKAAQTGVVAYAGNGLKGFGNLVLIQHDGGWVTAYAHNDRLLVKRGDKVRRGQKIALAGSTGSVSEPQLHFEIRKGRKAVNPASYLPR